IIFGLLTWGSAALHHRLYAVALSAGWDSVSTVRISRCINLDFLCKAEQKDFTVIKKSTAVIFVPPNRSINYSLAGGGGAYAGQ
ncbi:MAG TPA: hypothetical protein DCK93_01750, partial [Blastocatellia bacterium]|nr:hypothetical protein [Blastocatellia bacterium]